jgi:hypothetical protein
VSAVDRRLLWLVLGAVCVCADEVFTLCPASRDLTLTGAENHFFARVLACMGRGRTVRVVYLPCGDLPVNYFISVLRVWFRSV